MATTINQRFTVMLLLSMAFTHFCPARGFFVGDKIGSLKIASFNVRHFGRGFLDEKPEALSHLIKIMSRYDIVLVMETRDGTGTAIEDLKKHLSTGYEPWDYVASGQLGQSKAYLEQYVYFYKVKSATFVTSYQVNNTEAKKFSREPFCVEFAFTSGSQTHSQSPIHRESVVFLSLHTPPEDTRSELEELPNTVRSVAAIFPHSAGVIAMGDMNADCRYLSGKWRKSMEIFNGKDFKSLIADTVDTATKASSNCAYDRVVLYGEDLEVTDAKVFNFQTWLGLNESAALDVSDHFPVEFVLH